MQQFLFFFLTLCMGLFTSLPASDDLRILELLPDLYPPLAVDPALPTDFVAMSPTGELDLNEGIYWGPKEVLNAYFQNPASLQSSIIRVKLSENVTQIGPISFDQDAMDTLKVLKKQYPKGFDSIQTSWGDYPILGVRAQMMGKWMFAAWVGLNDFDSGSTLMINLVFPDQKNRPSKEDLKLWKDFMKNTTPLKDGDFFKAYGQDLQEGYTLVNTYGAKLKMIAEKRAKDGVIQIVVIPDSPNVQFSYDGIQEGLMGAKWKYGTPIVKVYGTITTTYQNGGTTIDHVTSIFYKTVTEFTFDQERDRDFLIFQSE